MSKTKLSDFYKNDYVDYGSYDNLRKIASVMDGQKNAMRKIIYTILEKNIRDKIKVSQLGSKVAEFAEYLHGNLDNVIVNLAQEFPGTNNIPLLQKKGNFGTRFAPAAAASRYIYTYGSKEFFELFNKDDIPVLKHQFFEGAQIEPMFYVPTLPILLINGSEGPSSGFAQKILPRDPKKMIKYISDYLKGKRTDPDSFIPHYKGFNGTIERGETHIQWVIKGKVEKIAVNKILITEVPIGYDLKGYLDVLDSLEEDKVILSYKDKCENDKFLFEVTIPGKALKEWDDDTLLTKLKLLKRVSENYTAFDENNKIRVFESAEDILKHYIEVKLGYVAKRKEYQIGRLKEEISFDFSKYLFIKMIVDDELVINKRKKADVIKDLDKVEKILEKDGSYEYLLNMSIGSLTKERMDKLEEDIRSKKTQMDELSKSTESDIWLKELAPFDK